MPPGLIGHPAEDQTQILHQQDPGQGVHHAFRNDGKPWHPRNESGKPGYKAPVKMMRSTRTLAVWVNFRVQYMNNSLDAGMHLHGVILESVTVWPASCVP